RSQSRIKLDKGNINGWLKALIALKNGDQQMVKESLACFLGRALDDQVEINMNFLLRLWEAPSNFLEDQDLAYYFPVLPTSITGLPYEVKRIQYKPPVLQ